MRRFLISGIAVAALAILATGGLWMYWLISAQELAAAVDEWVGGMLASGYDVNIDRKRFAGFPASVDIVLDGVELAGADHYMPWTWSVSRVRVTRGLFGQGPAFVRPSGVQTIEVIDDEIRKRIRFGAARWAIEIAQVATGGASLNIEWDGFVLAPEDQAPVSIESVRANFVLPDGDGAIPRGTHGAVSIRGAQLPGDPTLGNRIESFEGEIEFLVSVQSGDPWRALSGWTESNGTVRITNGAIDWGPIHASAITGRMGIDHQMRPEAQLSGQFAQFADAVEVFFQANRMSSRRRDEILFVMGMPQNRDRTVFEYAVEFRGGAALIDGTMVGRVWSLLPWQSRE